MTFEEALVAEFNSIPEISGNIFPVFAVESTEGPFMTYCSDDVNYLINLNGPSDGVDGVYALDVLHPSYKELQVLFKLVKNKIISFLGRSIGENGPHIQFLEIKNAKDIYEHELEFNRKNFYIHVKYKEV